MEGKERKSPRVFGPCLPSSFVPELRLFSWPSFSRFVHPWAQGRVRARARGQARSEKESDSKRWQRRTGGKEDEVRRRRRRRVGRNVAERRKKRRRRKRVRTGQRGQTTRTARRTTDD